MNLRKLSAMIVVLLIAFAYTIYSPAMAYQPANQPRFEKHQKHQDDDQNKDKKDDQHNDANHDQHHDQDKDHDQNNKHHDDQNHGDKNKHDNNDQHHHSDQDKSDNKGHKHDHDDNQQDNHKHHGDDQNRDDHRHDHDRNRRSKHHHHSWWDHERSNTVIIFGLVEEGAKERSDARHILRRTAVVLERAQQMARSDSEIYRYVQSHYQPGLGRAFSHQMLARELYRDGHYQEATFHSLHARVIALQFMDQMEEQADLNDDEDDSDQDEDFGGDEDNLDDLETGYWDRCPAESQMTFGMNENDVSDDEALSVRIELNF